MSVSSAPDIRAAGPADAGDVAALAARTFTDTFGHLYPAEDLRAFLERWKTEASYAGLIEHPDVFVALATDRGAPVGYVVAGGCKLPVDDLEASAGEVRELYVLASHQGQRLGTRLLEAALDWLDASDRAPLYVGVWSENDGAQRLYGRYGFRKVGEYGFPVGQQVDREFILKRED